MSRLRDFQTEVWYDCCDEWDAGAACVAPVMPTGGGKTVLMGHGIKERNEPGISAAHRSELVSQISIALAREEIRHDIVAPDATIRAIVRAHMDEFGATFYNPRAQWKVASVDTIVRRGLDPSWVARCGFGAMDESHHVLRDNKWGRAIGMFRPGMHWMLPTATPTRADGRGLGSHHDGLIDALVLGPEMGWMIQQRFLTPYRIIAPDPSHLDLSSVELSASGDFKAQQLAAAVKADTKIVGDVVQTYLKHARGLRGITFAADVEHATQIAAEYNRCGVPAMVLSSEHTSDAERIEAMRKFKRGELLQLVNVDLFGEGVDVPACQCVSMARPTESYALYCQQFGRALRLMLSDYDNRMWNTYDVATRVQIIAASEKPHAWIFDHVGNVIRHMGPPDWRQWPWTLDRRDRRTRATDGIPLRPCGGCEEPYLRDEPRCPRCGWEPEPPKDRSRPEFVDGDVILYTEELMQELFGAKAKIDNGDVAWHGDPMVRAMNAKRMRESQEAQAELRALMQLFCPPTIDPRKAQRRFFHTFGVDTLTAQGYTATEARNLITAMKAKLGVPQ